MWLLLLLLLLVVVVAEPEGGTGHGDNKYSEVFPKRIRVRSLG